MSLVSLTMSTTPESSVTGLILTDESGEPDDVDHPLRADVTGLILTDESGEPDDVDHP